MSAEKSEVFISFAYKDGLSVAQELDARLQAEGISTWFERNDMKGGEDWKRQILSALDQVRFLLLVLTKEAQDSEWVRWEWRNARNRRVHIAPVIPENPDLKPETSRLPSWIRNCDLWKDPSDRERLVLHIKSRPLPPLRVPFVVPDKPRTYVHRDKEYEALRDLLLDKKRENPVAITTAIQGGGGFGKSTLARALCHDEAIYEAFTDGIVWVELGRDAQEANVVQCLGEIYRAFLSEDPAFGSSATSAAARLAEKLHDTSALIVIDDVWHRSWLAPFLQGAPQCARLFTTRNPAIVADVGARGVPVDGMSSRESIELLRNQLAEPYRALADPRALDVLAKQIGEMPLLLELIGKAINKQIPLEHNDVARAVAAIAAKLKRKGVTAFDIRNESRREYSIARSIELSLEFLDPRDRERGMDLGIFPAETVIPYSTLQADWGVDDREDARDVATALADVGLLTANADGIRLHDVMRGYLSHQLGDQIAHRHARLIDGWGDPHQLPDAYAWRHYAHHLAAASRLGELKPLLLDYTWLRAKLNRSDAIALRDDAARFPDDRDFRLLARALEQSAYILVKDPAALRGQLYGRLMGISSPVLEEFLKQIRVVVDEGTWLRPLQPGLTPADSPLVRIFQIPGQGLSALALTSDSRWAVSGASDGAVRLWDLRGQESRELGRHGSEVGSVALTSDGRWAVSGSSDGAVRLWDPQGQDSRELGRRRSGVESVALTSDGRWAVSGSSDGAVWLWDLKGQESCELGRHGSGVCLVALTWDGRWAVSGSHDGFDKDNNEVWLWDLQRQQSRELGRHGSGVWSVALTSDGRWAVSGALDGAVRLWDLQGQESRELGRHRMGVKSVALTSDGRWAVSGSSDGAVRLWDLQGQESRELGRHGSRVESVALTSDGRWAVSGSSDGAVRLWDLQGQESRELGRHGDRVNSVALTSDGRWAVSGSSDDAVRLWDLQGQESRELGRHGRGVRSVALTSDGRWAVSGSPDGEVRLWDLQGQQSRELGWHGLGVNSMALTSDGRWAVSGSDDHAVRLWDLQGQESRELGRHRGSVSSVALTSDGRWAVSGSFDHAVRLWDLQGQESRELGRHSGSVSSVALTSDGRWAVSGSYDAFYKDNNNNEVWLWDLQGQESRELGRHGDWVSSVALTWDGRWAVSGSDDGAVRLWDLQGQESRELGRHGSGVRSVALTSDGQWAVSGSSDGAVRLWDCGKRQLVAVFHADAAVTGCAISSDGSILVAGDTQGSVHLLKREERVGEQAERR